MGCSGAAVAIARVSSRPGVGPGVTRAADGLGRGRRVVRLGVGALRVKNLGLGGGLLLVRVYRVAE